MTSNFKLRVLTFNVWGIPNAADRSARIEAIGKQIAIMDLDIVGLQETWDAADRSRIISNAKAGGLNYSHYFYSGIVGSGLLLLSRYPIVDAAFYRFRLGGKPEKVWHADYYGGKGIAFARIQTPFNFLDFYDVHAIAQFTQDDNKDEYKGQRTAGLYECARFVTERSSGNYPAILSGDLNIQPDQVAYRVFKTLSQFTDCYAALHPEDIGATYTPENPYVKQEEPEWEEPQRLDYLFVKSQGSIQLTPISANLTMRPPDPTKGFAFKSYSDHFGVLVEFTVTEGSRTNTPKTLPSQEAEQVKQTLLELSEVLKQTLSEAISRKNQHFIQMASGLSIMIGLIFIINRFVSRRHFLRFILFLTVALITGLYPLIMGLLTLFILPDEINSLKAILTEVELQIKAKRAFNNVSW